ncbi:MAG: LCP family protein, partial [Pseudonocardia sp.]|nr:LCP family protein [Pseudonocardia sp.]
PTRTLVAVVALLVFAVAAFQYVGKARLDDAVRQVTALDPESGAIIDAAAQAGDENVLLLGSESTRGDTPDGGPRTDTVLLAHVPAGGGDVVGMSIPYDLEVNRPPCRRWDAAAGVYLDETVPAEARTPLISAFDLGGPQCATRVVQELTGLVVTRFIGLDLDGVGGLVDAVGGVDVCVGRPVVDRVLGAVVPTAGTSTFDGARARDLVQARNVAGDTARDVPERQQRLVAALLEKVLSARVLLDPARIGALGPALGGALTVDAADLDRVLATASSLRDFSADGVTFTTVPIADGTSSTGNTLLRPADAAALFAALRDGEAIPEQTVLASAGGVSPEDVTTDAPLQVLNGSDRQGLAGEVGEALGALGVEVGEVANAPSPADETIIRFSPDRAAAAELLGEIVPAARAVPDTGASGLFQLVLGRSFDGTVRPPAAAAGAVADEPAVSCARP